MIYYMGIMLNKRDGKKIDERRRGSVVSTYLDRHAYWALMDLCQDTGDVPSSILNKAFREYLAGLNTGSVRP